MSSTSFVNLITLTDADWFNDTDTETYSYLTGVAGADTITATGPVSMTAYAAGQKFHFISAGANTGAVTLNITPSGGTALGAKALTKNGSTALAANDIPSGAAVDVIYDGTRFIIGAIALGTMATQNAESYSGKNIIINGGFTVNQRTYVSGATLASGAYGHDRFKAGAGGGDYSFTQLASNTTITIAANKTLIQVVEDKNVQGTSYVLSWTGTALARYAVNSATPAGSYAASPILITGQTVGTTMSVEFGNGASAGTLGNVQLEVGAAATTYENRLYGSELEMCLHYYIKSGNVACVYGIVNTLFSFQFPVVMRTDPTVVALSAGGATSGLTVSRNGFYAQCSAVSSGSYTASAEL